MKSLFRSRTVWTAIVTLLLTIAAETGLNGTPGYLSAAKFLDSAIQVYLRSITKVSTY